MIAFIASPGEEQIEDRQSPGANGQSDAEGMTEVVEADVVAAQRDLAFVDGEESTDGKFPDGVFEGAAKEQKVGAAEPVVGIAGEHRAAVDVGAADGRRAGVEWHDSFRDLQSTRTGRRAV